MDPMMPVEDEYVSSTQLSTHVTHQTIKNNISNFLTTVDCSDTLAALNYTILYQSNDFIVKLHTNQGTEEVGMGFKQCFYKHQTECVFSHASIIYLDVPKFPKEKIKPMVVDEGQPIILECNPPKGIPPLQIYWMTLGEHCNSPILL